MLGRWQRMRSLVVLVLGVVAVPLAANAQDLDALTREVTDIEGRFAAFRSEDVVAVPTRSPTYVEERLTDGELFFRLRDYVHASIIFTDIVDNFPNHSSYPDALFLLGESLFQAGDYFGARRKFNLLIDRAGERQMRPYAQRALSRLIEIAIRVRDFEGIEDAFARLSRLPSAEVEATTSYYRAKYLYSRALPEGDGQPDNTKLDEARALFESVAEGSPLFIQSRYFVGVILTLRREYPLAIEAFRRVLRSQPENQEQTHVIELTQLALGRLYYETSQMEQAIEAYQAVPRTSPFFDDALYEVAWVMIRLGDSTRAERALEVLTVATPESPHIPDGKILRGNLLLRTGRFEDALAVFREVHEAFGPVYQDLNSISETHADLPAYFRQTVRENMEDFDVNDFLPESARAWVELEGGDFDRATTVLGDLSQARTMVRETDDLIVRIQAAIHAPNRVGIFSDLRHQREGTTGLLNRMARVRRDVMTWEERNSPSSPELTAVREERRRIESFLGGVPTTDDDFIARDDQLLSRYRELSRELADLDVEILGMEARIVATETFMRGQETPNEAVAAELVQQRAAMETFRTEATEIKRLIDIARIQVGVGDARYERDTRLREEYTRLVAEEHRLGGGNARTEGILRRLDALAIQINTRDAEVDGIAEERISDMRRVVDEESSKLIGYRTTLSELEGETEEVVGAVTYHSWRQVRDRFYDLVLRADVGRIDVSWAQREEHRSRVDMLTRERSREIQAIDDEFRDIMDERSAEEESADE